MRHPDICIAGAGIIGLSLALELDARGLSVTVIEARDPLRQASSAAAGMLAAQDPHNPLEIAALSRFSVALYPEFLDRLRHLSGIDVPFQTDRTLQQFGDPSGLPNLALSGSQANPLVSDSSHGDSHSAASGWRLMHEHSIDPRQLAAALLAAVSATPAHLLTGTPVVSTQASNSSVTISTPSSHIEAAAFVDCTGAWANDLAFRVAPIKGQMLSVALPADFLLRMAVRTREIYIVPRTMGPNAGQAIIGATVEDAGFDTAVHADQIEDLRHQACALLPQLAHATVTESWSGLRPAAPDRLPLIGAHPNKPRHWAATGHYRNGILLAPATARIMTQLLLDETPEVSLSEFAPARFVLLGSARQ